MLPRRRAAVIAIGLAHALAPAQRSEAADGAPGVPTGSSSVALDHEAGDGAASAAAGSSSVALDYEAADGCPSAERFAGALAARGVRVEPAPGAPAVRVRIATLASGFAGALSISSANGPFLVRNLDAPDCAEIVSAFALVAAVTSARGGAPQNSDGAAEAAAASTAPPAPKLPPALPKPKSPSQSQSHAHNMNGSEGEAADSQRFGAGAALPPRYALGLGTLLQHGVLPDFGAGLLLYGRYTLRRDAPFAPSLVFGLGWSRQELVRIGRARFDWISLHSALCPWQWPGGSRFELRPCLAVDTGILRGEGIGVQASAVSTAWWLAPGLGLRAEGALGRWLFGLAAGAYLPLFRDRFYFGPNVALYRPGLVTFRSELSLGLGFW